MGKKKCINVTVQKFPVTDFKQFLIASSIIPLKGVGFLFLHQEHLVAFTYGNTAPRLRINMCNSNTELLFTL